MGRFSRWAARFFVGNLWFTAWQWSLINCQQLGGPRVRTVRSRVWQSIRAGWGADVSDVADTARRHRSRYGLILPAGRRPAHIAGHTWNHYKITGESTLSVHASFNRIVLLRTFQASLLMNVQYIDVQLVFAWCAICRHYRWMLSLLVKLHCCLLF